MAPPSQTATPPGAQREYYAASQRLYARLAAVYDIVALPLARLRSDVVDASGAQASDAVLDVGTGTGDQALAFAARCREVVGLDLSSSMLDVARRKSRDVSNVRWIRGDAAELPFEDESFDVSSISFTLHEMPRSVREKALREMARVTRASGKVVIADFGVPRSAVQRLVHRVLRLFERDAYPEFIRSDLHAELASAGLEPRLDRSALLGIARIVTAVRPRGR